MASTHKSLRSGTADKRPTTSIADGQIALNTNSTSPGLFFKDSTGATIIKVGPVHVGTTAPNATPAGSTGNSTGEVWLDTSLTPPGVKIWDNGAWTNATPAGSTTVQGLLELATNAETQTGSDTARAVTPAGLQSKVSDSTSTTSSTTIASSTAVKSAYDLANAALPKAGGTVTGTVTFGTTGVLAFEGSTDDGFETALAVVDPTADRTITLPNVSGTVVTTGDTGTVTSTMIADGTIVNADINASAAIALSKLGTGALPTAITVASANIVDGTIVDADINAAAAIAPSKLGTGALPSTVTVSSTNIVDGTIVDADISATAAINKTKISGTAITAGDTGTVTSTMIADGAIVDADINASAAISKTKISGTAITAADTGTVTSTMIVDGTIVNGDINASAGIAHSKLATITAGSVLLGNATNVPTATALSGDVTVNSSGVTAIGSGVIVNADINASAAIADTKLATISTAGKVSNSATTATDANTASAIVARDASGNFSAGTITASLSGSATSAATLTTARTINGVSFNGSADINIPDLRGSNGTVLIDGTGVTSAVNYVELTNAAAAGTVTLSTNGTDTNIPFQITTKGTGSVSIATAGGNIALRPTAGAVLLYDATNTYYTNLENGTLTANRTLTMPNGDVTLTAGTMVPTTGTGATGTWGISISGSAASASTATTLATARTINGTSFNGSANITTASWGTARSLWGQSVDGSANVTGPLYPAAGSVSAPAFSTSGDTNTGVYFPAADTIGFSVGGAIGAGIDSSGNLQLYNSAGTFYHNFSGQPTANRTITLPDASVTLVSGTMVPTTGTGATGSWGISVTGNAATATTLATARTINGTSFNGSANITTASWGTARTFTFAGDVSGSTAGVDGAANETFTLSLAAASVSAAQMDGGQSGSAPVCGVRGWVTFDGSVATPTIRNDINVTSITDLGSWGNYRVNWTTAMPNVNYAACITSAFWNNDGYGSARSSTAATTAYYYVTTYNPGVGDRDSNYISVMAIV